MPSSSSAALNDVIVETGAFGWYQKRTLFIVCSVSFLAAMQITLPIFTASIPRMECTMDGWEQLSNNNNDNNDDNDASKYSNSKKNSSSSSIIIEKNNINCNNINVDEQFCHLNETLWQIERASLSSTIGSKWGLYCDEEYKNELLTTVFFMGFLSGNGISGALSGTIGRYKTSFLFCLVITIPALLASLAPSYGTYLGCRLCIGVGCGGFAISGFVLLSESVGEHYRSFCSTINSIAFSVGLIALPGIAFLCRDWRYLTFLSTIPLIAFFFLIPAWLFESPYWLLSKNKIDETNEWLHNVDKINNTITHESKDGKNDVFFQTQPVVPNGNNNHPDNSHEKSESSSSSSSFSLLIVPVIRKRLLTMAFVWFAVSFSYYGLSFNVGNLGSNLYLSVFLSGLCEIPTYAPAQYFLERVGRQKTLSGCLLLSTLSYVICLTLARVPLPCEPQSATCWQKTLRLALSLVGKSTISTAFTIIYVYSAELFPTDIRSLCLSLCSMAARLGSMSAPMVLVLGHTDRSLPFVLFGTVTAVSTIMSFCLPETLGQALPETIHDLLIMTTNNATDKGDKSYYSKVNNKEEDEEEMMPDKEETTSTSVTNNTAVVEMREFGSSLS